MVDGEDKPSPRKGTQGSPRTVSSSLDRSSPGSSSSNISITMGSTGVSLSSSYPRQPVILSMSSSGSPYNNTNILLDDLHNTNSPGSPKSPKSR